MTKLNYFDLNSLYMRNGQYKDKDRLGLTRKIAENCIHAFTAICISEENKLS